MYHIMHAHAHMQITATIHGNDRTTTMATTTITSTITCTATTTATTTTI